MTYSEQEDFSGTYENDKPWQRKARIHQSNFRKNEMKVPAVPNKEGSRCYGNVISREDAEKGIIFYAPFWPEIKSDLKKNKRDKGQILTNILRSEHIPYNIFYPMRRDLNKAADLFRLLTGKDVAAVQDIIVEYKPLPKQEYIDDGTAFDTYVEYTDSQGRKCGIGIEVKYTEMGYNIGKEEKKKVYTANSPYYIATKKSGCFEYGEMLEEEFIKANFGNHDRGTDLRQIWRNHILGLSMIQRGDIEDFLSIHLYPGFNEHFNPETSDVLKEYTSLLSETGKKSFMPLTYETLFDAMKECGMDEIDEGWIPYLIRRYIIE